MYSYFTLFGIVRQLIKIFLHIFLKQKKVRYQNKLSLSFSVIYQFLLFRDSFKELPVHSPG